MTVSLINVGQVANDGTGDDLREAFIKINQNFEELDLRNDEQTTASNIGNTGEGIFSQKIGYDLQFKRIIAGQGIVLTSSDTDILIETSNALNSLSIGTDNGFELLEGNAFINVLGGNNIVTKVENGSIVIDYNGPSKISDDTNPQLSGTLDADTNDITNVGTIDASQFSGYFTGNLDGTVYGVDIRNLSSIYQDNNFDFGGIYNNVSNLFEWLMIKTDINFETFLQPSPITIDLGSIV